MAAALAWSFLGDDYFCSVSGSSLYSITILGFLYSYLEDLAEDSDDTLVSNKLFVIGNGNDSFCALLESLNVLMCLTSDIGVQTAFLFADWYFIDIELIFLNLGARIDEQWTFWALVLLMLLSSSHTLVMVSNVGSEPDVDMSSILSSSKTFEYC